MPSSAVACFTDPDRYAAAIRAATSELTITAPGRFSAKIAHVGLHDLWMQHFWEQLPRIRRSALQEGRAVVSFQNEDGPNMLWDGVALTPSTIIRQSVGGVTYQRSPGRTDFASMSLPVEVLVTVGAAVAGRDLMPARDATRVTPPPENFDKLRRLHAAAIHLAEHAPIIIAHAEAARGLEQALIEAMIACLSHDAPTEDHAAKRRHDRVMRRFHAEVGDHPGEAIYIPQLCAAVGVPQRTLHLCCEESLGMGPKRYLTLRRMNLARRALRDAGAKAATVTEVAASFGFWNFGRFSVEYKALFGETPSSTLRMGANSSPRPN